MLVGVVVLVGLVAALVPYLASTRIVRDRIAVEMSSWTGYRVEIGAPPDIDIWPRLRAVLKDVTLFDTGNQRNVPVVKAERVEIMLSALAALSGDAVFTSVRVVRPEVQIATGADGLPLPHALLGGRIADAIAVARQAVRDKPEDAVAASLPTEAFGTVHIVDGRFVTTGPAGETDVVGAVDGSVDWPSLDQPGHIDGTGVWRGETVSVNIQSKSPLLLLAGGRTGMTASMQSQTGTLSFDGVARLSGQPSFDGEVSFSSPSVDGLAKWAGARLPEGSNIGAASLSATVSGSDAHFKFDNARIDVNGSLGRGAIEVSLAEKTPRLSGSLAFERLDIGSLLAAFTPLTTADNFEAANAPTYPQTVAIDLRFSAARATAGAVQLTDVAANAQIRDTLAALDISDATAFGGTVQAGLRFDRKPDGQTLELRLLAADVDGGPFGSAIGMTRLTPIGKGTVSVILKGPGADLAEMLEQADGSVSASFGPGALSGFDLAGFLQRTKNGGFFSLDEVSKSELPIGGLELEAAITKGVARISKGEARLADRRIWISGIVPYAGRGLALSGGIGPLKGAAGADEAEFFVGGTWDAPFVAPNLTDPAFE